MIIFKTSETKILDHNKKENHKSQSRNWSDARNAMCSRWYLNHLIHFARCQVFRMKLYVFGSKNQKIMSNSFKITSEKN